MYNFCGLGIDCRRLDRANTLPRFDGLSNHTIYRFGKGRTGFVNRDGKPTNGISRKDLTCFVEGDILSLEAGAAYSESPYLVTPKPSKKPDNDHCPNHLQ